jgi:ribosomal protein L12E/L44/L45/RPP1/RPP2
MPLVLDTSVNGGDRFSLLLRLIQAGNASEEVYRRAYESAQQIEDANERLDALISLLDEVDFDTNNGEQAKVTNTQATAEQETPPGAAEGEARQQSQEGV